MPKYWRIKPGKSLRENARLVVPLMIDDFLSHKDRVIEHPRLKLDLHRMRLDGKTLRYTMEVFEQGFPSEFASCLDEVKRLLEKMGSIHDCDVNTPRLQAFLAEIRSFNRRRPARQDRMPTSALIRLIREQSKVRRDLFTDMTSILREWEINNFKQLLLQSMEPYNTVKE